MAVEHVLQAWSTLVGACRIEKTEHGQAWMVYADNGGRYVLKKESLQGMYQPPRLASQIQILAYLADRGLPVAVPLPTDDARLYATDADDIYTLQPMLPSRGGDLSTEWNDALYREIGSTIARLHIALAECPHSIESWNIDLSEQRFGTIWGSVREAVGADDIAELAARAEPLFPEMLAAAEDLPIQRIHGDCHGGNILVADGTVSGLVDLDHLPTGPRIYDLAYNLSLGLNWMIRRPDPEERPEPVLVFAGTHLLSGYHAMQPLSERELAAVVPIMLEVQIRLFDWIERNGGDNQMWLQSATWMADHYRSLREQLDPATFMAAADRDQAH